MSGFEGRIVCHVGRECPVRTSLSNKNATIIFEGLGQEQKIIGRKLPFDQVHISSFQTAHRMESLHGLHGY